MSTSRRSFLVRSTAAALAASAASRALRAHPATTLTALELETGLPPGRPGADYTPTVTPNGLALPFRVVDGVKVFHLVAENVEHEFAPGMKAHCSKTTYGPSRA